MLKIKKKHNDYAEFLFDYNHAKIGNSLIVHADCLEWMGRIPENSIHAVVTDPPYGVKEYDFDQSWAVFRYRHVHELSDDAAEICLHQERLKARHALRIKLAVHKIQKIQKFLH